MDNSLTKNFTLEEFERSATAQKLGIKNNAPDAVKANLKTLCEAVLQPLRDWHGKSIDISSGYRCKELNKKVGGSATSQHIKGEAADINIHGDTTTGKMLFEYIKKNLVFDQLIWEHDARGTYWIHVSYKANGKNRKCVIGELLKK